MLVRSDLKGQGLGRLLLGTLLRYQTECGTRRLVGDVLHENHAMRGLARSLGMHDASGASAGGDTFRFVLDLQPAASAQG